MISSNPKYLSYFWNEKVQEKVSNNKLFQKAQDENSSVHLIGHLVFAFILIVGVAFSLRFLEINLEKANLNPLSSKVALASEKVWGGELSEQSAKIWQLKPGTTYDLKLKFANKSTETWTKTTVNLKALTTAFKFYDNSWNDLYLPTQMKEDSVLPGQTASFELKIKAPKNSGEYSGEFILTQNNIAIIPQDISIKIVSTENPNNNSFNPSPTVNNNVNFLPKLNSCNLKLNFTVAGINESLDNLSCVEALNLPEKGPDISVGLFYTDQAVSLYNDQAWQVLDGNNNFVASIPANQEIRVFYNSDKKQFAFDFIDRTIRVDGTNLKFKNFNSGIFTISSFQDLALWNKTINYNQFRGDLELSLYDKNSRLWMINTLPLEDYLKGIKETSNPDPAEYQKAMTIAARTYALYHINKYQVEKSFFDMYNDERSQVYKGYVAELIMPQQANIVDETSGVIVTFNNEVIIAYYSARSGGQTVTKNIPYLRSVSTPYTANLSKNGHGWGIDAFDAKNRAEKEGWSYDRILRHYYKDIYLEKIY